MYFSYQQRIMKRQKGIILCVWKGCNKCFLNVKNLNLALWWVLYHTEKKENKEKQKENVGIQNKV